MNEELVRLRKLWAVAAPEPAHGLPLSAAQVAALDRFDRVQLEDVVRVCRASKSLSDAGRTLFAASRAAKSRPNDADRLRKYLARFGLSWEPLRGASD